jgi:hypothetical protein
MVMKRDVGYTTAVFVSPRVWTLIFTLLLIPVLSAAGQNPKLRLPDLGQLAARSSNTVDISLDGTLLSLAARFLNGGDNDERAVKEMLTSIKGIYVKTFEFDRDGSYSQRDLDAVREQLTTPGWARLVGVGSRRDRGQVDVYVWTEGDKAGGMAIIAAEARQVTIVNIVGAIDFDKLRALEGQLGVPRFDLERRSKSDRRHPDDQ